MYAWLTIRPAQGAKQLVLSAVPQGSCVCLPAVVHRPQVVVHPPELGRGSHGWEKDLQFIATCPIHLPQLPKSVSLFHILGQPAHPEVVDQRSIMSHIGYTPHSYCALQDSQNHSLLCKLVLPD